MNTKNQPPADLRAPREQMVYANLLTIGVWTGLLILLVTYFIYLSGILPPRVPAADVPGYWGMGVDEYLAATAGPRGWGWARLLGSGDYLPYLGFAFLALTTVICYFSLIHRYFKTRDRTLFVICVLEVLVLCLAASGLLGGGGH